MQVIAAMAEFERDLLIERTQSGIIRAKAAGKKFGRPPTLNAEERATVLNRLNAGVSIAQIAREFKTTRQTIMRTRDASSKLSM
jgi:putative DNA-invertase from lambdoid prophage Rac